MKQIYSVTKAYHSTRQKGLKKFESRTTTAKIDTGEGAHVHGWGLYLQVDEMANREYYYDYLRENYRDESNDKAVHIWGEEFLAQETDDYMSINDTEGLTVYDIWDYETCAKPDITLGEELLMQFLLNDFGAGTAAEYLRGEIIYITDDEMKDEDYETEMMIHYSIDDMKEAMRLGDELEKTGAYRIDSVVPEDMVYEDGTHDRNVSQYTVEIPDDMVFIDEDSPVPSNVYIEWYKYLKTLIEYKDKIPDNPDQAWYDEHMNKFNGWRFYQSVASVLGDQEKASLWLSENGIDGMTYEGGRDNGCFVIYNCDKLKIVGEY